MPPKRKAAPPPTDGDLLMRAILEEPGEDTPRLAYADWLEENGRQDRAELIRRFIRRGAEDRRFAFIRSSFADRDQAWGFFAGHKWQRRGDTIVIREWMRELDIRVNQHDVEFTFRDGFIDGVEIHYRSFASARSLGLFRLLPLTQVWLGGFYNFLHVTGPMVPLSPRLFAALPWLADAPVLDGEAGEVNLWEVSRACVDFGRRHAGLRPLKRGEAP